MFGCGAQQGNPKFGNSTVDSAYDQPSSDFSVSSSSDNGANALAPLRDAVVDSPTEVPASSTLTFTLDVIKCFRDRAADNAKNLNSMSSSGSDWNADSLLKAFELPDGVATDGTARDWATQTGLPTNGDTSCLSLNLNARSEPKTGGTDSAIQSICIQFAPGALTSGSVSPPNPGTSPIPGPTGGPTMFKQSIVSNGIGRLGLIAQLTRRGLF